MANISSPLVSIIIPCYNGELTIVETLESVIGQTYNNIEVLVINDGSTDATIDILEGYKNNYEHISVFNQLNKGLPASRNAGFRLSKGKYVVFLDADDLLDESFVKACISEFYKDESLSVVYTQTQFFERETGIFKLPELSMKKLLVGNCLTATAMIKSSLFKDVGMYDERLNYAEDWEIWIRLFSKYPNFFKIERPLFLYRRRNSRDSMTDLNKVNKMEEEAKIYIYNKHYNLYKLQGMGLEPLINAYLEIPYYERIRMKYYNEWYRKILYKFFRPKKYKDIYKTDYKGN
ncbi:glycosyltransferase [Sphingobacterium sp. UT-1RO-CII-1]|uniref:glycosyltransferase n=1 Tax=Sphingobacterium sp. UT-1RO-CII-1 TaxID=2995225 RepID=UPI00227B849F|nr:glycosyltransferase [Sphingobacterium sp. UT-1RO-CII-1]MCY4781551.1 glycosyltransferase [Sphingobacterium sp. UT-1RO-CII-1]